MGWLKKLIPKEIYKPIKSIIDPAIDFTVGLVKAVISPFTGAFNMPDESVNFGSGVAEIKANLIVDFNGANRSIPVIYGTEVDTAIIPVFVGVQGDSAGGKQYLYMAGVISQGFTLGSTRSRSDPGNAELSQYMGAKILRMTIDGKPVHLSHEQNTGYNYYGYTDQEESNIYYSEGTNSERFVYDKPGLWDRTSGIFASGYNGMIPHIYTIDKGTFADRLKIQYFDGSSDQPASTLLQEHSDWTADHKLSGLHYVALRFELKSAEVAVLDDSDFGPSGIGTYGNPYSGVPSVVVTVQGRATPNIVAGRNDSPGYEERFQTNWDEPHKRGTLISPHKRLDYPKGNGEWVTKDYGEIDADATLVYPVGSDSTFYVTKNKFFQPIKDSAGATQDFNIHDILYAQGWTYDYVWFYPGRVSYSVGGDSTITSTYGEGADPTTDMILLKNVGSSHYKFVSAPPIDSTVTISGEAEITFFGYNSTHIGDHTQAVNTAGASVDGHAKLRLYGDDSDVATVVSRYRQSIDSVYYQYYAPIYIEVRDIDSNYRKLYNITSMDEYDSYTAYVTFGIVEEDSTVPTAEALYRSIPDTATITFYNAYEYFTYSDWDDSTDGKTFASYLENSNKAPANWDIAFTDNEYKTNGLQYQSYQCDKNSIEYLLDYMLNPNYGVGLTLADIDKASWLDAAIACDRIDYYISFFFGYSQGYQVRVIERGEEGDSAGEDVQDPVFMYGPNAVGGSTFDDNAITGSSIDTNYNGYDRQFIIDTSQSHMSNINRMLSSIGAYMPYIDGKYHIFIENAGDPRDHSAIPPITSLPIQTTITEDNVFGSVVLNTSTINDKFNSIKIDFTDAEKGGQPNSVIIPDPIEDSAGSAIRSQYLAEDNNKVLEGNFSIPSIFDKQTAKKYGRTLLKKSRGQPTLSLTCSAIALNCVPGDFVRVKLTSMKIDDVYRIIETTLNYDNTIGLQLIKHDPDVYNLNEDGDLFVARKNIMT